MSTSDSYQEYDAARTDKDLADLLVKIDADPRRTAYTDGYTEMLIHALEARFGQVPSDLRTALFSVRDPARLGELLDLACSSRKLATFRKKAHL